MPKWAIEWAVELLAELISKYITPEMLAKLESQAKKWAYEKLKDLAADTKWTDIDDKIVEKIGDAWQVKS